MPLNHLAVTTLIQDRLSPEGDFQAIAMRELSSTQLATFATRVFKDPLLKIKLSDRVYQLLLEDLKQQKERYGK
jgi:hypothetical protein